MVGGAIIGRLVSSTTLSGHFCSDLIRMIALSMMSGRSGKLAGRPGKVHPAISRRTVSALPTVTKYLARGTADSSRNSSTRGQPMAATLDHTHVASPIDKGAAPPHRASMRGRPPQLGEILLQH